MHVNWAPPVSLLAEILYYFGVFELTVVDAVRDTAASLAVNVADILLQARVRDAASAVRDRTVIVLGPGCRQGKEREERDGESELHCDVGYSAIDRKMVCTKKSVGKRKM